MLVVCAQCCGTGLTDEWSGRGEKYRASCLSCDGKGKRGATQEERIAALTAENAALRKTLEWYADEDNYRATQRLVYVAAPAEEDRGRRARAALSARGKGE